MAEIISGRFGKDIAVIHAVEPVGKCACHFKMLFLIFAYGDFCCAVYQYVGSHEARVGQQTGVQVVGLFACLVLKRCAPLKFAEVSVHIEIDIKFDDFRDIALDIQSRLFGVDTCSKIFGNHLLDVFLEMFGKWMCGQRMDVGDEEIALIFILHLHEVD